ncbi:MAG TPA: glycosyltransferase, partial [Thermomicrobiaceae bacterium]|nr:glycosyltransferase [Thermomicrobiaceae bacterium]
MATKRLSVITHTNGGAVVTSSKPASGSSSPPSALPAPGGHASGIGYHASIRERVATIPYFVRVMTRRQTATFIAFVTTWLAVEGFFWSWWLRPSHVVTWYGMLINSLLLAWPALMSAWFFFFVFRMKRPNPELPVPAGRVAMVVTKAPSEPWPIVRETLEAMLAQRFPHPYDVWLADEDPSEETRRWCASHGVQVSCRKGVAAYHRETWPRRTKCKEGNLAYFYDTYGYEHYDYVSQLDADHVPSPTYLEHMIRPFNDPAVGYVAAPSICDKNIDESWVVRGRLSYEASFHGPQQAGYNDGFAPSCIGSHYAIRTTALREIGGLGPELAEDFTTTLMMNAGGWRGVFAIDAIAHGDGAGSFADSVIQEFQWSRSLVAVLLSITPKYWSKLPRRLKLQFGLVQVWYPITALYMAMIYVFFGLIALASRTPWVRVDLVDFVVHAGAIGCVSTATVWWLRRQGWLRPKEAEFFSWELMLFQMIRWPWMLYGTISAIVGWARKKTLNFRVTPKGANSLKPLPLSVLVPYVLSAGVAAATALVCRNPGHATGYYLFGLMTAVIYLLVLVVVPILHAAENWHFVTSPRPFTRPALAAAVLLP